MKKYPRSKNLSFPKRVQRMIEELKDVEDHPNATAFLTALVHEKWDRVWPKREKPMQDGRMRGDPKEENDSK